MYISNLFEAVYISHVLTLEKKGLECVWGKAMAGTRTNYSLCGGKAMTGSGYIYSLCGIKGWD